MSFDTQERSVESGQPIELYDFRIGTEAFLWTTNPTAVTYDSLTYTPLEITREAIFFNPDERAEALKITVPASTQVVRRYINGVPGQRATITIFRVHRNDGDDEVLQMFKGVAKTVAFSQNGLTAEIAVLPISGDLADAIPRFVFSTVCNNILFDTGCKVSQSLFRHQNVVSGVSNDTLTINGLAAKGDNWATGGYVALSGGDFRLVVNHTGDTIRLLLPFPSSPIGQTVEVFAGCDHSISTCKSKFNNVENFGGFAWVPLKNIFSSGLDSGGTTA